MKRFPLFVIATLTTGIFLAACNEILPAAPTIAPTQPVVLEPTLSNPTAVVLLPVSPEPSTTPKQDLLPAR
jgi:hypothetical protein